MLYKTGTFLISVFVLLAVGSIAFYLLASKGIIPVNVVPSARTLYTGQVSIEPISASALRAKLKERKILHSANGETVTIYPHGAGIGPVSFSVSGTTLLAEKDIPGIPDIEKYKAEVRADVRAIGDAVTIRENTWKITKTTYPWMVIY